MSDQDNKFAGFRASLVVGLLVFSLVPQGLTVNVSDRAPTISFFDVLLPILIAGMTLSAILGDFHFDFGDTAINYVTGCYLMANILSMMFNYIDELRGILAIKVIIAGYLSYVIVRSLVRRADIWRHSLAVLMCWGATIAILVAVNVATASSLNKDDIGIAMGRSNYLAAMLVPLLPIAVAWAFLARGWIRALRGAVPCVIFSGIVLTISKGAVLSLFLGTVVCAPVLVRGGVRFKHVFLAVGLICLLVVLLPSDFRQLATTMVTYRWETPDFSRYELWAVAWREFLGNPLLGVGPDCIYYFNRQFTIDDLYTHNYILNVLADVGIIGAIPFLCGIAVVFIRVWRRALDSVKNGYSAIAVGFCVGITATLIHGLVEPTFQGQQYAIIYWVTVGLLMTMPAPRTTPLALAQSQTPAN